MEQNRPTVFKLIISSSSSLANLQEEIKQKMAVTMYRVTKTKEYKDRIIDKEYEYLDITPSKTNKSEVSSEEVMAIGDNLNDIDMIRNSGIGVAVANSYDAVKAVATYTTVNSVENSGFAEAVYKYISF